jgi:hypothetical protein
MDSFKYETKSKTIEKKNNWNQDREGSRKK